MTFELPALPYAYNALEPHIDARTMEIHYSKHHAAYTTNLNNAIKGTEWENKTILEILASISKAPIAIRNNGGGFFNHNLFWEVMSPNGGGVPSGKLAEAINKTFGSFDEMKTKFNTAATTRFGSGWAWLSVDKNKNLCVCSSPNQDNPLMDISECAGTPIMGLDVWEHAYYLHYQNRRPDYINAFWNVVNWKKVEQNFELASK